MPANLGLVPNGDASNTLQLYQAESQVVSTTSKKRRSDSGDGELRWLAAVLHSDPTWFRQFVFTSAYVSLSVTGLTNYRDWPFDD